ENTLDSLRLGKIDLSRQVLDVLFEAIEVFGRLLAPQGEVEPGEVDVEPLLARLRGLSERAEGTDVPQDSLEWVGEHILSVLRGFENNQVKASEVLGIHRNTLRKKLQEYGMLKDQD
ncbi:MAG TPA: helix-turn-helix domain-containing protein, partial [Candidatus Sumerlaeota bacterium]|nr:helix-turn-helix domain-containing protein [Candidatus Sumerlaeota bacterium]